MSTELIAPPFLKPKDKIAVVSLASQLDKPRLLSGLEIITTQWDMEVIVGSHALDTYHNFAGKDEVRLAEFQEMLDNPDIKAIIAGRGGYGTSRIIDQIDWTAFKNNPKWLVGFSDITILHQQVQQLGFQSIHGPMMVTLENDEMSTESLHQALLGGTLDYTERGHYLNKEGSASGTVIGGNLCLLAHNIGSASDLSFDHKILFIEDIGEYLYNIDRMMVQLKRAGKLKNLAALIVGQFSDAKEQQTAFGKNANEIILEHTASYDYPICFDFPLGHDKENRAIICGAQAALNITKEQVKLRTQNII